MCALGSKNGEAYQEQAATVGRALSRAPGGFRRGAEESTEKAEQEPAKSSKATQKKRGKRGSEVTGMVDVVEYGAGRTRVCWLYGNDGNLNKKKKKRKKEKELVGPSFADAFTLSPVCMVGKLGNRDTSD